MATNGEQGHGGLGDFRVPDYTEPIRGYRKWLMKPDGWLTGVTYPQRWTPGVNEAVCCLMRRADGQASYPLAARFLAPQRAFLGCVIKEDGGLAPAEGFERDPACPGVARGDHGCGFYARHGGRLEYDMYGYDFTVSGVVDCWGQVELGPHGVRAQFARIVAVREHRSRETTLSAIQRNQQKADDCERQIAWAETDEDVTRLTVMRDLALERVAVLSSGPERWAGVRAHYPDVPVFSSEDEMLAAFPVPDLTEMIRLHAEEEK